MECIAAINRLLRWSKEGRWGGCIPNCGRVNYVYIPDVPMERECPTLMFATKETPHRAMSFGMNHRTAN